MGKIRILDEATINKIAAGEVIERPASIVKELVENSIDAGATAISVEIQEGGKSFINVSDNGCGIMKEDTEQVFFRHATSKIKDSADIQGISTLGFRGEAMASIAAVSEVELLTKAEEDTAGSHVIVKGGKLVQSKSIGYPTGTSVTVRDLFFNTPARLKFLKSDTSEQGAIVDIIEKLAMTNTGISMKLTVNNKVVLHTPGNGDLLSVILCIYGKNISGAMLPLEYKNDIISIEGYIGKPEIARGNSTYMTFSVNKRYVKNRMMAEAVKQAYKTLLMNNRYPFSIININIKSEMTDVNVHPTKQEVKLSDERAIFNTLYLAVKNCLNNNSLIFENLEDVTEPQEAPSSAFESRSSYEPKNVSFDQLSFGKETAAPKIDSYKRQYDYDRKPEVQQKQFNNEIRIIGQLFGTYILGQMDDDFCIIDQHAAHERIMFEYIKEKYNEKNISVQELMMPIVIELSPAEKVLYTENSLIFQNLGFEIEWFGENTLAIRAVPILMGEPCTGEFFSNILDSLKESTSIASSPLEKIIISMACKNSIKAGDNIAPEEISVLLERLMKTSQPYTCPHGRPTIITMSRYELEKKFKRII
ncbi:MAG TPA: DNA mismatch repair endonuclease MutL [Bacillota bacterium]|jgi:DNA mismatch repair protein MutL|nr:DNA mismatch repair endonuclease MutL [Bacillota bacterium]